MIALARKFMRRPAADRRLLVRAVALHAGVAALVRVVRFGRINRWLNARQGVTPAPDRASIERVVWAVRTAATVVLSS